MLFNNKYFYMSSKLKMNLNHSRVELSKNLFLFCSDVDHVPFDWRRICKARISCRIDPHRTPLWIIQTLKHQHKTFKNSSSQEPVSFWKKKFALRVSMKECFQNELFVKTCFLFSKWVK
jgi:hypothetical protein